MTFRSPSRLSAAILIAVALVRDLATQTPGATSLIVLSKAGRSTIPTTTANDQDLVALDDLAAAFQLTVREESGAVTVSFKGKTIVLTPDQALASVAGRLVSLPSAPSRSGRRWLVPLEFISRALALIYDVRLDLRKASHLLIVGDLRVPHLTIRLDPSGTNVRLTIDAVPRAMSTVSQDSDKLTIKFDADALDVSTPLLPPQPPSSLVQYVRLVEPVTLVVELGPRFGSFRAVSESADAAARQVIDLLTAPATDSQPGALQPPAPPEIPPALTQSPGGVRTIVVDPGHGGEDEGVKGASGLKEKDLTLAIARRVKAAIEGRLGVRVLLTRDDDRNVAPDDRTAIANNNKADLFLSLHANASLRKSTSGAQIYVAGFGTEAAQEVNGLLRPERVPTFGGGLRDIELVPWDLAQIRYLDASNEFAKMLVQQFQDRVPLAPPPIAQAPIRVLRPANMPAVLVEIGYLSNPDQEKHFAGNEFQAAVVQALFDAVLKFRDSPAASEGPR